MFSLGAVIPTSHQAKGERQYWLVSVWRHYTKWEDKNQSSMNYLPAKINLIYSLLFLSTHFRLGSNAHWKKKSTTMCILLITQGFPPTHFPALIKSNIRTSKYQDIKILGIFPAIFLKKLCMLARVTSPGPHSWGNKRQMKSRNRNDLHPQRIQGKMRIQFHSSNSTDSRISCCYTVMHFYINFKILGWGDHFVPGAQTPLSSIHSFPPILKLWSRSISIFSSLKHNYTH